MSDEGLPTDTGADSQSWLQKERALAALRDAIRPANKTNVFDALAAACIVTVVVTFDGCGDSGQIENVEAHAGDETVVLPAVAIEIAQTNWGSSEPERTQLPLVEAIESLVYDFLRETHEGWENNAGAFGEFTFDVADRSITLDYNERFESSEYSQHVF